ncbi:MAG: hypothetical protein HYS17_11305 [Micavibrio aeruginosavorus]|uniref:Queuosine 5'-phosphate N-glycosylase/hydrolase n=1 Tax=Micavibrio aeruginosavorus TaxID=349221 RepID=A0A7T5UHW9_9BACT|nr:MAG: hypothetical protein HYS17_11305 [Micavibrio aeruginosavorus]
MKQNPSIQTDIFDDLRAGFAHVAAQARHVHIRRDRLDDYAALLQERHPSSVFDTYHHYIGKPEDTAAYVLALDAINYGSGYKPVLVAEGWPLIEGSIYYSVATRLKRAFERKPLTAADLATISAERVRDILGMPVAPRSMRLCTLFAEGLRDLGCMVMQNHQGSFLEFIAFARGSAAAVVERLAQLPQFRDVHDYRGVPVAFYKRAQIAAADLHLSFNRLGRNLFHDMHRLTMFADNGVPQVLEADGVLEYAPELKARILKGEEIASGSEEEIEIRGCGAQVVEEIARRTGKTAVQIDHALWHRHADVPAYKSRPSHKTLCVFY